MNRTEESKLSFGQDMTSKLANTFFIECYSSSEDEEIIRRCYLKSHKKTSERLKRLGRNSLPLPLLAFSSGQTQKIIQQMSSSDTSEGHSEENSDCSIEEWMIIDEKEQVEDLGIQLNLRYHSSSGDKSEDETNEKEEEEDGGNIWTISDKDKRGSSQSPAGRYFLSGCSLRCLLCNRTGHTARSCSLSKKPPVCVLCGTLGHVLKACPSRPCLNCGLPPHGLSPCKLPPVWSQHCRRCGVTGHVFLTCPDVWRQYHTTIRSDVPFLTRTVSRQKHQSRAHCYNCAKRGHYGHDCTRMRMMRGIFTTLPHVCHYDSMEDIRNRLSTRAKDEFPSFQSLLDLGQEPLWKGTGETCKESLIKNKSRTKKEASDPASRRKTWPERRRERREVKHLRRKARTGQDRLLGKLCNEDDSENSKQTLKKPGKLIQLSKKKKEQNETRRKSWKGKPSERSRRKRQKHSVQRYLKR